jgi:hypothetical protein
MTVTKTPIRQRKTNVRYALEQAACALRDLVQLLAPLRWGCTPWSPFIQPKPKGRGFELSSEVCDPLGRNADRGRDSLKIRVRVGGHVQVDFCIPLGRFNTARPGPFHVMSCRSSNCFWRTQ